MRRPPVVWPVAVVLLLSTLTVGVVAVAVLAPPVSAAGTSSPVATGTSTTADVGASDPDNLSIAVRTPRTITTNASQNYSVDVTGASGNTTVTWSFEGERKSGKQVTHAFAESGNATIEVTVTDESGATASTSLTVDIVEFDDESDSGAALKDIGTVVAVVATFIGFKAFLFLYVFPKGMRVFSEAL